MHWMEKPNANRLELTFKNNDQNIGFTNLTSIS